MASMDLLTIFGLLLFFGVIFSSVRAAQNRPGKEDEPDPVRPGVLHGEQGMSSYSPSTFDHLDIDPRNLSNPDNDPFD